MHTMIFLALVTLVFWLVFVAEKRLSPASKKRMFVVADRVLKEVVGIKAKQKAKRR